MKNLKYTLIGAALLWVNASLAQKRDSLRVLFVGNSYTYVSNMPHMVALISDSTKTKLITQKSTFGGSTLANHWNGEKGLKSKELIKNGHFDIVVIQEHSMGPISKPDSFLVYAKKFCDLIKASGAKPYLYETWNRKKTPETQKKLTEMYTKAAKENGAQLVRVGEARELALKQKPELELYLKDESHPSPPAALLAACMFVKALTGQTPTGLRDRYMITDNKKESVILMDFIEKAEAKFDLGIVEQMYK